MPEAQEGSIMTGIPTCDKCGSELVEDITLNQFMESFGVSKGHIKKKGMSYESLQKYGDTPISELPNRFQILFKDLLNRHGVKYA